MVGRQTYLISSVDVLNFSARVREAFGEVYLRLASLHIFRRRRLQAGMTPLRLFHQVREHSLDVWRRG